MGPDSNPAPRLSAKPAHSPLRSHIPGQTGFHVGRWLTISEPWLSAEEIAAHLGVTKDTVYAWIADKAMPAHKVGRLWKFQASEVDSWVRSDGAGAK